MTILVELVGLVISITYAIYLLKRMDIDVLALATVQTTGLITAEQKAGVQRLLDILNRSMNHHIKNRNTPWI